MAAVKTSKARSKATPSNCVDPLDIEQYINTDKLTFDSPPMSPATTFKSSTAATPNAQAYYPVQAEQQTFSGPSHQYEQYRQQSSLPVGAVANTVALNESAQYYGQDDYDMIAPDSYLDFDISNPSDQADLEMDFNTQPGMGPSIAGSLSPPAASQPVFQPSPNQHVRAWPGMHQQAALQAKAQAEAQAQRLNQMRQQTASRSSDASSTRVENEEPRVEESISRLLNRMRHSSVSSSQLDDRNQSANGGYLQGSRSKKDEEDMDEDERLLASEEGKKLSSKERRQLRNKVSARAFRSRRKEYIGQLEGEIAGKAAEADRLRVRNEQLVAENGRLTDLTRMLLSSPHFSSFLNDLSANKPVLPQLAQAQAPENAQPAVQHYEPQRATSTAPKDANPHLRSQQNLHVGLAMIPESQYEHDRGQTATQAWAPSQGYDQRVFAVRSIPEEPVIESGALSGKSIFEPLSSFGREKEEAPTINSMPEKASMELSQMESSSGEEDALDTTELLDASNPAFALFVDEPSSLSGTAPVRVDDDAAVADRMLGSIAPEKAFERFEIVLQDDAGTGGQDCSSSVLHRLERMRGEMDCVGGRIDALTRML